MIWNWKSFLYMTMLGWLSVCSSLASRRERISPKGTRCGTITSLWSVIPCMHISTWLRPMIRFHSLTGEWWSARLCMLFIRTSSIPADAFTTPYLLNYVLLFSRLCQLLNNCRIDPIQWKNRRQRFLAICVSQKNVTLLMNILRFGEPPAVPHVEKFWKLRTHFLKRFKTVSQLLGFYALKFSTECSFNLFLGLFDYERNSIEAILRSSRLEDLKTCRHEFLYRLFRVCNLLPCPSIFTNVLLLLRPVFLIFLLN